MDERRYRFLKYTAITMALAWLGWAIYTHFFVGTEPGDYAYHAGSNYFADGYYEKALTEYEEALKENPSHRPAMRGSAETLIMLKREWEAIGIYDALIAVEPDNAGHYTNRGIAYDRLGEYEQAVMNYDKSLSLDPETGKGPGWLTRLMRKQAEKPPGIADRAGYLRQQLALPRAERLLRVPELDAAQRPYKD